MGRPKKDMTRSRQVGLAVTPELLLRLKATALVRGVSVNGFINDLIERNTLSLEETRKLEEARRKFLKEDHEL